MNPEAAQGRVFVGRNREMSEMSGALDGVLSGRGGLVMLAGEPGIGKTRIAQELAAYAEGKGVQALWGRCHEEQGTPPYWPWVQIIRSYVQQRSEEELVSQMGIGAAYIAEIVPEVRERVKDLGPPPSLEPEATRFRFFDAVSTFLKRVAQIKPMVLLLEDLHWADQPSLLLLEFINAELLESPLLVVGTYRDAELIPSHPLSHSLGELARHPSFREFLLQGLPSHDVQQFIAAAAGIEPPEGLVKTVYLTTEGNPLFMTQIVDLLVHQGSLSPERMSTTQDWSIEIPQGVRMVVRRGLARLSQECNQTLGVASVIGREFDLALLQALPEGDFEGVSGGVSSVRLLEVLEEALTAHVIEELKEKAGRYQFSHVLIQQTLAEGLSADRRARLHARITEALEQLYRGSLQTRAAELAYHSAKAEPVLGTDKLVRYSIMAGDQDLAAYAHEEALALFQQGLAVKKDQPLDDQTASLLFGLARAQGATGQVHDAWATLGPAFDYYVEAGDVAMAVAVAEYPLFYVSGLNGATRFVSEALALVPPDSLEAGRLLSRLGLLLNLDAGDYEGATEAFGRALTIAQRERDAALEMRTLAAAADAEFYRLHWSSALEKNLRVVELAQRANDPSSEAWPHWLAAFSLLCLGRSEQAMAHATAMQQLAEKLHNRGFLASAWVVNANVAHAKGDWQVAREFYDRELAQGSDSFGFLAYRTLLDYESGDFSQGEARLARCLELKGMVQPGPTLEYGFSAMVIPVVARITGDSGRLDVAGEAGESVISSPSAMTFFATIARTGLGLLAVLRDDAAAAEEHYAILREYEGTLSPLVGSAVDRVLGLLAQTMGDLEQASSHFEDSLAFCGKAGYRPELAWTCCDYADVLLLRNGEGDRAKALSLLDESLALSSELGMRPLMERVAARREGMGLQQTKAPDYPDSLSRREVEVLRLVALGRSNREIGEELFITSNTVARHISNIFTKTGVSNRAEAATYASRQGLVS